MPLILASLVPLPSGAPDSAQARRAYLWIVAFTALGLCAWEFIQARSNRFVFDTNDLVATVCGSALAYLAFRWHVRNVSVSTGDAIGRVEA
jgi:glycopeptide antibiotics resistance protein